MNSYFFVAFRGAHPLGLLLSYSFPLFLGPACSFEDAPNPPYSSQRCKIRQVGPTLRGPVREEWVGRGVVDQCCPRGGSAQESTQNTQVVMILLCELD